VAEIVVGAGFKPAPTGEQQGRGGLFAPRPANPRRISGICRVFSLYYELLVVTSTTLHPSHKPPTKRGRFEFSLPCLNRQGSQPDPTLRGDHDRTGLKGVAMMVDDCPQVAVHVLWPHVSQSEGDHTRLFRAFLG
jgi:hypothetical protein